MTITELELIQHLDFHSHLTCETYLKKCPNPVSYRLSKDCCDKVYLLCKECGELCISVLNQYEAIMCHDCEAKPLRPDNFHLDVVA